VIAVPVFDAEGRPTLAFTVYGFSRPDSNGGLEAYIARTLAASRRATELLGGTLPAKLAAVPAEA
jgi:DNA-binding IclR family transcriptional regulator